MSKDTDKFDSLTNQMLKKAERGMRKAVVELQKDTQLLTHVDSGALRRSWTHDVQSNNGNIIGTVGSNLPYAVHEDNYHPTLTKALDDNLNKYMSIIQNEIKGSDST